MSVAPSIVLENGIDIRECTTRGSFLEINNCCDDLCDEETNQDSKIEPSTCDTLGAPVKSFADFSQTLMSIDEMGYVKKKILSEGGGSKLNEKFTISIAFSAYWENEKEPFDKFMAHRPLKIDLNENGQLPGLQLAVKSMLVGEVSVFLLSYKVMYGIMGNPPRIKPKADCVYYIKLIRSVLTPKDGPIDFSERNIFHRVKKEVTMLYQSGVQLHSVNNFAGAAQLFRKSVNMLEKCRLADEKDQIAQEKLLIKLYMNLAVCYVKLRQPLKACTACNNINDLSNIWNNGKALFLNAKALRMIGDFKRAQKKLNRAMTLCPNSEDMAVELELLKRTSNTFMKLQINNDKSGSVVSQEFKNEILSLIRTFKDDDNLSRFPLPSGLSKAESEYVMEVCKDSGLFCMTNARDDNLSMDKNLYKEDDLIDL